MVEVVDGTDHGGHLHVVAPVAVGLEAFGQTGREVAAGVKTRNRKCVSFTSGLNTSFISLCKFSTS